MTWILGVVMVLVSASGAQAPQSAPAGTTGICRDGSYSMQPSKDGACQGHKGVQTWYAAAPGTAASTPRTAAPAAGAVQPAAPIAASAPPAANAKPATPAKPGPAAAAAARTAAPGGGPGLVWVNTSSNVYHCYGDTYYGKTKAGAYMSEADAKSKGAHGERGATCTAK